MQLTTTVKKNVQGTLMLGALTFAVGACAHGASHELVDARRAYDDAASSPARTRRPNELEAAHVALDRAEDAHDQDPGSPREKRLANEAEHRARVARAHGEEEEAERDASQAEREAAAARARADEAERSKATDQARANNAEVRAERAEERADRAEDRRAERSHEPPPAHAAVTPTKSTKGERARERRSSAALQNLASVATVREEPRGVVITLSGALLFPSGQAELSPIARQNLDQVAHALAEQPAGSRFQVAGYTDNSGTAAQNKQLSEQRARAVADHLVGDGIDRDRIAVDGYGEARPIVGNDTPEGQATNRRVEIVIEPSTKTASR